MTRYQVAGNMDAVVLGNRVRLTESTEYGLTVIDCIVDSRCVVAGYGRSYVGGSCLRWQCDDRCRYALTCALRKVYLA
jgi:hypothetical protein